MALLRVMVIATAVFGAGSALAQDRPAATMQILKEKVKADKKLVVALNVDPTEAEARAFWPIYEAYQKDLEALDQRLLALIEGYAADYRGNTLTDAKAERLLAEALAIEEAEVALKKAYVPRLRQALPAIKVARYIQVENKIRAVLKYDLATQIPLAR